MALKIFPYALVRYAAMPFSTLEALHMPGVEAFTAQQAQLQKTLQQQQQTLCDQLYTAIQAQEDHKQRQHLLQLKREVYNGKHLTGAELEKVDAVKEPVIYAALQAYLQTLHQMAAARQAWELGFDQALISHRKQLQQCTQNELLRSGILLSSPVLYTQLDSFAAADASAFRNRELKNEYSLLRYITRMAGKTSPFSTFTCTGTGTLDDALDHYYSPGAPENIRSSIRLHNGLFSYIRSLMIHHPVLNEILSIRLNVTATVQEEQLHFLVNYFNVEAFQRLPARNLPLWLFQFLREQAAPVTMSALIDTLCKHIPDTDRATIKDFLLKLAAAGFLETGIGCSGVDPDWDAAFMHFLSAHTQHTAVAGLQQLLQALRDRKLMYAGASSTQRYQLLQETATMLNQGLNVLQEEAGLPTTTDLKQPADNIPAGATAAAFEVNRFQARSFTPQDIFYEDTGTPVNNPLPAAGVQAFINKAERLCALLGTKDALLEERQRMRNFFLQHYGISQQVPITAFYHAYYLHEKKQAQAQKQERPAMELPDGLQLAIAPAQVSMRSTLTADHTAGYSRGMFVQFYNSMQNGKPALHGIINALLPGMGKVAGRFLHLLDPAVADSFKEWNAAIYPHHRMIELNDGSTFNANIHPPLLPYEICMPGGNNNYPQEAQVSLQHIQVKYNPEKDLLALYHTPDGKEIYAYDLCLESFYNRSHFYQLLAHFNPEQRLPLRQLILAADRQYAAAHPPQEDVQLKPRITFEEQVVLRRKGWLVKTAAIPAPENGETNAAYFVRLHEWRQQHGLPAHVFIFLRSPYIPIVPGETTKLQRDDYKPQYICFDQPLLVGLFRKLLARAGAYCYLEEMLPHAEHLAAQGPESTVTEYLLHWYKY